MVSAPPTLASSSMVNSVGLPMLMGPVCTSLSISFVRPVQTHGTQFAAEQSHATLWVPDHCAACGLFCLTVLEHAGRGGSLLYTLDTALLRLKSQISPCMRSDTYWKERVWEPSPKIVSGCPVSACMSIFLVVRLLLKHN